jgi:hypothetical protein
MAGYSGTPLVKKLGIKEGHHLIFPNAPREFLPELGTLPPNVVVRDDLRGKDPFHVIVLFVSREAELRREFRRHVRRLVPEGGLWVAWPKRASRVETNLTEARVQAIGLEEGLVDNKVCAIDNVWSGLRFVIRRKDRPAN